MIYLLIMILIVVGDQLLKLLVVTGLGMYNQITLIPGFFYLSCIPNDGIAMGMFAGKQLAVIIMTGIIMLAIAGYIFVHRASGDRLMLICLSAIVGGGIGNIIDRIRLGYVIDYLDFRVWSYIFNFADIFVVVGCFALVLLMVRDIIKEAEEKNSAGDKDVFK